MVLALLASTFERSSALLPATIVNAATRSQLFLSGHVHPMFGNALFMAFTAVSAVLIAGLFLRNALFGSTKPRPSPGAYTHDRIQRDTATADARPEYDVCIIGGGVVGAALAAVWGRSGARIAVVERDLSEPDRIVGELLQPSGVEKMKALGLYDALTGIDAQSVPGYAIVLGSGATERVIRLPYPNRAATETNRAEQQFNDRFTGRGLHNGRFLMNLRRAAATNRSVQLIQGNVSKLLQRADGTITGVVYTPTAAGKYNTNPYGDRGRTHGLDSKLIDAKSEAGAGPGSDALRAAIEKPASDEKISIRAGLTVVVDGCLSVFRRPLFEPRIGCRSKFLGLVLHNCVLPEPGCGNVILANPSPVLVYPISSTETRMLIDFPELPDSDEKLIHHFKTVIEPQLPESVRPSFRAAVESKLWITMPNQNLCTERPNIPPGCLVVGDSLNMRHPLTGGGMTVGLTDVELLAQLFTPHHKSGVPPGDTPASAIVDWSNTSDVHRTVTAFYEQRLGRSAVINILADALYQVFLEANPDLRVACFDYLSGTDLIGRLCYEGPVSLLAGINRSQTRLVVHFFSVALYAVGRLVLRLQVMRGWRLFQTACRIILPLLVQENNNWFVRSIYALAKTAFRL